MKPKCKDCKYFKQEDGSVYGNCSIKNKTVRTNSKICKSFAEEQEPVTVLKPKSSNKIVIRDGVKYYY